VLCQKLAFVVGHEGQCQMSLTHDSAKKPEIILKTGRFTVECQSVKLVVSQSGVCQIIKWYSI
jgi:hypothetical protein